MNEATSKGVPYLGRGKHPHQVTGALIIVFVFPFLKYLINTVTFNSGYEKSPEFDYTYFLYHMGIHYIYWLDYVLRFHPLNFTPVGVITVKLLHLKSQIPMGFCQVAIPRKSL